MNIEDVRDYCLQKENVTESLPFDEDTLVYKTNEKIFLILSLSKIPPFFNVKTNPEWSEELREHYPQITAGYHMNKKHWNSVYCDGLSSELIQKLIDHSYDLVSPKKKIQKPS